MSKVTPRLLYRIGMFIEPSLIFASKVRSLPERGSPGRWSSLEGFKPYSQTLDKAAKKTKKEILYKICFLFFLS